MDVMLVVSVLVWSAVRTLRAYRARQYRRRVAARYPIANRYRRPGWAEH